MLTKECAREKIDSLTELKSQVVKLMSAARDIVSNTGLTGTRAERNWISSIERCMGDRGCYDVYSRVITLQDTIDEYQMMIDVYDNY